MEKQIVKPSILPGFMELLPAEQISFNWMMDTIRKNYESFGFTPIDTPTIEKSEILLAKGGGETEKQIYRFSKGDTDMSLRFDLTVPLARYVAQHYSALNFPFRRYHIAKVFRGERNQKGRYREFYQCDIDIIGNNSLSIVNDAEIPSVIYATFKDLGFDNFVIRINNRKVLNGFFDSLGIADKGAVLRIIDKIDKIGVDNVKAELAELEVQSEAIEKIIEFISIKGKTDDTIETLKAMQIENESFLSALNELETVVNYIRKFQVPDTHFVVDLTIARGLDYYTGTVYETILSDYPSLGSVCSGGRYDNLAENYTKQSLPGVGISIGLTRLFYQLNEAKMIQMNTSATKSKALLIAFDGYMDYAIELAAKLRANHIICEVYFEEGKIRKKFGYADKQGIPYAISIGENEVETSSYTVKDMATGEQKNMNLEEMIKILC